MAVTQPHAKNVRRQDRNDRWAFDRPGTGNGMIVVPALAIGQRFPNRPRRPDLRPLLISPRGVLALLMSRSQPAVVIAGHDDGPVGELDLVGRQAEHDVGHECYGADLSALIEDLIAGMNMLQRDPS